MAYSKLKPGQIRLLAFVDDSGLKCRIQVHDLEVAPRYIALSYTWRTQARSDRGDTTNEMKPELKHTVQVNESAVIVQENLYNAMTNIGKAAVHTESLLWVDFLCINQADPQERGAQVAMMSQIFDRSHVVGIWLGVPANQHHVDKAVDFLGSIDCAVRSGVNFDEDPSNSPWWPTEKDPQTCVAWYVLMDIVKLDYWTRAWVYQESSRPGKISFWYGDHWFFQQHWYAIYIIMSVYNEHSSFPQAIKDVWNRHTQMRSLIELRSDRSHRQRQDLLALLDVIRSTDCYDPRDKVYAIISLAHDVEDREILIDYTQNVVDVYVDVVRHCLRRRERKLDFLGFVTTPGPVDSQTSVPASEHDLPCWVPDWSIRTTKKSFSAMAGSAGLLYSAWPGSLPEASIEGRRLIVRGLNVDAVSKVGTLWSYEDPPSYHIPRHWIELLPEVDMHHIEEDMTSKLNRCLVADAYRQKSSGSSSHQNNTYQRGNAFDWELQDTTFEFLTEEERNRRLEQQYMIQHTCFFRRLGITQQGRIGIFPETTAPGDRIVALAGGQVLYVVRSVEHIADMYHFVGECYVDRAMDGQAVDAILAQGVEPRMLSLI